MNKFVNDPARVVDDSLMGIFKVHAGVTLLEGHRVIIRNDIEQVIKDRKVTIISGGGSGHEPSQAGFVGKGMLSAAVCGSCFTSPPSSSISAALRSVSSPAGSLMIVTNYTGDRLTFGIAAERAKSEGMKVEMIVVGDDTAMPCTTKGAGRRGLCGTILIHKIAGALAEEGTSLQEIVAIVNEASKNIGTMSVSLSSCCIPGQPPSFVLLEDEMELGLGVHGEAGTKTIKIKSADEVVCEMLTHLTSRDYQYRYFLTEPGMEVNLIVNNLGSTTQLELAIVARSALQFLREILKLQVVRVYMGRFMTSLEMAGVSLTLMRTNSAMQQLLDKHTTAPGWNNCAKQ